MSINRINELIEQINQRKSKGDINPFHDEDIELLVIKLLKSVYGENINEGILSEIYQATVGSFLSSEKIHFKIEKDVNGERVIIKAGNSIIVKEPLENGKSVNKIYIDNSKKSYAFDGNLLTKFAVDGRVDIKFDLAGLRSRIKSVGYIGSKKIEEEAVRSAVNPLTYAIRHINKTGKEVKEEIGTYSYSGLTKQFEPVLSLEHTMFPVVSDLSVLEDRYFQKRSEAKERLLSEYGENLSQGRIR